MITKGLTYNCFIILLLLLMGTGRMLAFEITDSLQRPEAVLLDSLGYPLDTTAVHPDSMLSVVMRPDSMTFSPKKKDHNQFKPNSIRAMWLGLVFPGGGQMYNRKFWKLPIIYGGFLGCVYALTWNGQMLRDYSQAYLDIMDDDPGTASYEKMLPMGYSIEGKEERFKTIFKNKKNYYRKYRDMSVFAFAGVYLISVIDAYIDAELSTFDISPDLTLHLEPAVIRNEMHASTQHNYTQNSYGIQCSLDF